MPTRDRSHRIDDVTRKLLEQGTLLDPIHDVWDTAKEAIALEYRTHLRRVSSTFAAPRL